MSMRHRVGALEMCCQIQSPSTPEFLAQIKAEFAAYRRYYGNNWGSRLMVRVEKVERELEARATSGNHHQILGGHSSKLH